jgi:hypothetical protein
MKVRDGSLFARLGSERVLHSRQLWDASTYHIGHMKRAQRAWAIEQPKRFPSPRSRV